MESYNIVIILFFLTINSSVKNEVECEEINVGSIEVRENEDDKNPYQSLFEKIIQNSEEMYIRTKYNCVIQTITETVHRRDHINIIFDTGVHEGLLQHLQRRFPYSFYTNPGIFLDSLNFFFYHLAIFDKNVTIPDVLAATKSFSQTKFVVIAENYEDALKKFKNFWEQRIINVVAIFMDNKTSYYYTYFPYYKTHCGGVGTPQLIAKCDMEAGVFSYKESLFPDKAINLFNCPINITLREIVPSAYYTDSRKLIGWDVDLLGEIMHQINGIPNYTVSNQSSIYTKSTGYSSLVENAEVGGSMIISLRSIQNTDFLPYGASACSTWIVPKKFGEENSIRFLYTVFSMEVWVLIILTLSLMVTILKIFTEHAFQTILFKFLPYIFGNTTKVRAVSRIMGVSWLWFCLTMTSIYQGGFQSKLFVPTSATQLSDTHDVMMSNLKITGFRDILIENINFFIDRYNISDKRTRLIERKFNEDDFVHRLIYKKDSAYLGFKELAHYIIDKTEMANKVYIQPNCIITYHLGFVLKKNSFLSERFMKNQNRLLEAGLVSFFLKKHLSRESKANIPKTLTNALKPTNGEKLPSIDKSKILAIFLCHLAGNCLSTLVFMIEIMSKCNWRKIKKNISKEIKSAWNFD